MYLHPLIHSELARQHQLELSRRTLRAPLSDERATRSLPSKETAAKIGTLIIAMLATLAFTAPGGYSATGKKAPHGKSAKSALRTSHRKAHPGSVRVVSPRILYFPGPTQPPVPSSTDNNNDDCVNYELNCTEQQNCELWGVNCDLVTNATNHSQAASQDSSTSDSPTAAATRTDSAPADPATDAVASSDNSATDTTSNLVDPTQNDDDEDC